MKLSLSLSRLQPVIIFVKKYITFMFGIVMLLILCFFVFRINQFSRTEPSNDAIDEKLQSVKRLKLDKNVVEKIQQLQDQNVQVQSLFDQARNNPFSE